MFHYTRSAPDIGKKYGSANADLTIASKVPESKLSVAMKQKLLNTFILKKNNCLNLGYISYETFHRNERTV